MFEPQPTPYGMFYGMGTGRPGYAYNQQPNPQNPHLIPAAYLDGEGGPRAGSQELQVPVGGAGGGSYGPSSGLPVRFAGRGGGIGASGPGGAAAASGPAGASLTLLFTSPAFNNHVDAESGAFQSSFNTSTYNHHPEQYPASPQRPDRHHSHPDIKMDADADAYAAELAAQEAAARQYQPYFEGPLVGDMTPSHVITEQYAAADPVYVEKTLALPQTYSHYRPIRGDGNCGWRAVGFCYFEALIKTGNASIVHAERNRITQYPIPDHPEMVYDDMREEVVILMDEITAGLPNQAAAMAVLVQRFNDADVANHILYYLRLLASSCLKNLPDEEKQFYVNFMSEQIGIKEYCQNYIEIPGTEIDQLGLIMLSKALLENCGMVIEIAMLTRSAGAEVNKYRIPSDAEGRDVSTLGPMINLLFRPDHYDIIYPRSPPSAPLDVQVNRASSFSHHLQISPNMENLGSFHEIDMSTLSMIPGLGQNSGVTLGIPPLTVPAPLSIDSYTPSPQSPWMTTPFSETLPIRQQQSQLKQEQTTPVLPQPALARTHHWRYSELCHPRVVENDTWRESKFTTSTFKNSHYNKAHFANPDFQPEEYRPEQDDDDVVRPNSKRKSH